MRLVGTIGAAFPSAAEGYEDQSLDLNDLLVPRPAATFFMRATGSTMAYAGIHHGDLLVVDRSLTPDRGRIVVAAVGGELCVGLFEDVMSDEAELWGVVTASICRFNRHDRTG